MGEGGSKAEGRVLSEGLGHSCGCGDVHLPSLLLGAWQTWGMQSPAPTPVYSTPPEQAVLAGRGRSPEGPRTMALQLPPATGLLLSLTLLDSVPQTQWYKRPWCPQTCLSSPRTCVSHYKADWRESGQHGRGCSWPDLKPPRAQTAQKGPCNHRVLQSGTGGMGGTACKGPDSSCG